MPTYTLDDEVSFIAGVYADGTLPLTAYYAWKSGTIPADYGGGYTNSRKWGGQTAGTPGGTINYYFDPASAWTAAEQQELASGLALWSAVANISFALTTDASQAQITFTRGSDGGAATAFTSTPTTGAGVTGGSTLIKLATATITIDTSVAGFGPISNDFSKYGGYPIMTLLHEEGHALGLGHAGPYNSTVTDSTQQFSQYDMLQWSIMSYIWPDETDAAYYSQYPASGTVWNGFNPTTWMPADILALQRLYGMPTSSPLSGGQVFGYNCNIAATLKPYFDFTQNVTPVVTLWDMGTGNTLDMSGSSVRATVNLNPGTFSSTAGLINNIAIAFGTVIDTYISGTGGDNVTCNNDGDRIVLSGTSNTVSGGTGNDDIQDSGLSSSINGGGGDNRLTLDRSATDGPMQGSYDTAQIAYSTLGWDGTTIKNIQHLFLKSGSGNDMLTLSNLIYDTTWGGNSWDGGAGNDTIILSLASDTGGISMRAITGGYGIYEVIGGSPTDLIDLKNIEAYRLQTGSGNDSLVGGSGNDNLDAGTGTNTILAGTGDDIISDAGTGSTIDAGDGSDTITVAGAGDTIDGGDGTDTLTLDRSSMTAAVNLDFHPGAAFTLPDGTSVKNVEGLSLTTGSGDDSISFGDLKLSAPVTWNGGGGNDTATFDLSGQTGNISIGNNRIAIGTNNNVLRYSNIETFNITFGSGDDELWNQGDGISVTLDGGAGFDWVGATAIGAASGTFTPGSSDWASVAANVKLRNTEQLLLTTGAAGGNITFIEPTAGWWRNSFYWYGDASGDNDLTIDMSADTAGFTTASATRADNWGRLVPAFLVDVPVTTQQNSSGYSDLAVGFYMSRVTVIGGSGNDTLHGTAGDDTLKGAGGTNTLDGGAGNDTAVFAAAPSNYWVARNADGSYVVETVGETDTLTNIEQASYGSTTLAIAAFASEAVNPLTYIASYADLIGAFGDNAQFGLQHYFNNGKAEGRTITFNALDYIASYGDLIGAFGDDQIAATEHYIKNGYSEGRKASFNALNYIASYSDLIGAFGDNVTAAEEHYIKNGFGEGRTVSFDPLAYLCSYGDLMGAFSDNQTFAVEHYIKNGYGEGRSVSFNALNYIASYGDLIGAFGDNVTAAEEHYIKNGYGEGRKVTFDPVAYLINNTDLGSCGFTASNVTEHYINNGYSEHRTANGSFGSEQTSHALTMGGSVSDTLATSGNQDWFGVTLTAGQNYTFTLSGADGSNGTLADPFLSLYNAHGLLVTSNNDATGHDSKITFTATASGTFYLVAAANDAGTGTYKLFGATGG